MPSSPSGCTHTWSAPASRCARTTSAIAPASPWGITASIRRSEPPSARSRSVKPSSSRFVRVVAHPEVALRERAGHGLGAHGIRLHDAGDLGRDELARPDALAGHARVLDGHEVGVGARGALRRQVEHLRAQRGQAALVGGRRLGRRVQGVEERPHRRERPAVVARGLGVTDPDAEHEPARERGAEHGGGRRGLRGIAAPDVEDPGRGDERRRRLEDRADVARLRRAAHPPGAEPERLGDPRRLTRPLRAERAEGGPDADPAELDHAAA